MDTGEKSAQSATAGLGCGGLFLIAWLIIVFSGDDDEEELAVLRDQTNQIQLQVISIQEQAARIEAKLDSLDARMAAPTPP